MDLVDEKLASAAMAGDQRAFEVLFLRYHDPLLRYIEHLTASRYQAEDLVQDVFVRFLRQRSYRPDRQLRPWLFAVATNAVRDHLRAGRRIPPTTALEPDQESPEPDPLDAVSGRMAAGEVSRLLNQLPLAYRETIALRVGADMALTDIAQALNVPVGTVKSRLSVGLKQLRALMAQTGGRSTDE